MDALECLTALTSTVCRNLYPIPRFNGHTIPERTEASFGKVKVLMYPKSAGNGIVASTLVSEICKMAGIHDIGVKVHGSRNPRNTGKERISYASAYQHIFIQGTCIYAAVILFNLHVCSEMPFRGV